VKEILPAPPYRAHLKEEKLQGGKSHEKLTGAFLTGDKNCAEQDRRNEGEGSPEEERVILHKTFHQRGLRPSRGKEN